MDERWNNLGSGVVYETLDEYFEFKLSIHELLIINAYRRQTPDCQFCIDKLLEIEEERINVQTN